MKLETLYKTSKTGATQVIDIEIIGDTYTRTWGQLDGKMQTKATTVVGLNIGKANETTPGEQALKEANAIWVKKQKANYSTSIEAPVLVELPMKVNEYKKHLKKVIFPCYTSAKLNGVNAEYRRDSGELVLLSRGGENYTIPEHQRDEVLAMMDALEVDRLNGEMYIHGEHLQDITSAIKKPKELSKRLIFYIFDLPTFGGDYSVRAEHMSDRQDGNFVRFVPIAKAYDHEGLRTMFEAVTADGYEGLMVRNAKGLYEYNVRSYDVLKYKVAQDAEFEVVSYSLDKNGHAVFVCDVGTELESLFKVKLKGTAEERLAMAAEADKYIGKFLKVEFEMYSNDGLPLKPVGIMFRKVTTNGEAIE